MNKTNSSAENGLYIQQENRISEKTDEFIRLLTKKGIIEDKQIDDDKIRIAQKEKKQRMYHNTQLLLENYRNIAWALECFPDTIAEELDFPLSSLDTLLDRLDTELGMDNRKLESRMQSIQKSRLLMDRINEALSILKKKPVNGDSLYNLIYLTYIAPEKLTHEQLLEKLYISSRQYYRNRKQAISILSIRLWSAPASEIDSWLEVLTLLQNL